MNPFKSSHILSYPFQSSYITSSYIISDPLLIFFPFIPSLFPLSRHKELSFGPIFPLMLASAFHSSRCIRVCRPHVQTESSFPAHWCGEHDMLVRPSLARIRLNLAQPSHPCPHSFPPPASSAHPALLKVRSRHDYQ